MLGLNKTNINNLHFNGTIQNTKNQNTSKNNNSLKSSPQEDEFLGANKKERKRLMH